ncbi:MAG TPA: invasion associated locus B family protein [Micropepsaceae bacterium]|nr:invasion associated locus B family protein [Micropepsaceae bacterium]
MALRVWAGLALASSFAVMIGVGFAAEPKLELLGTFKDWHVYTTGTGANRLCYALAEPLQTNPANLKRDQVFFLISTWPGKKVRNEPSVVPGYQYKDMSQAEAQVGSDKFAFYTKNEGAKGGAWLDKPEDEKKLIDAMKRGSAMTIIGTSTRGNLTRDNYSLAGLSAALEKIDMSCK